ncbi:hypothetical protein DFH11DRAFT_1551696 [Phellopilus nigrolimitatus]|nr:hypothetical protein DFH11DRAFT_1551696 [Phellopilus nigrolimitatus]
MSFPASGRGHDGCRNDAPSKSTSPGGSVPPNGPPGGPNGSPDPTDDIVNRLTLLFLVILRFMISLLLAFAYAVATVANTGLYPDRGVTDSDSDGHPPDGPPGDPGGPRAGTSQTAGVPQSADSIGDCNAGTRWYCVFVGREVGIYNSWDEVVTHTTGVPGQSQRRYASQAEATQSFNLALASGRVRRIDTAVPATASTHNVPTRSVRFEPPSSSQTFSAFEPGPSSSSPPAPPAAHTYVGPSAPTSAASFSERGLTTPSDVIEEEDIPPPKSKGKGKGRE